MIFRSHGPDIEPWQEALQTLQTPGEAASISAKFTLGRDRRACRTRATHYKRGALFYNVLIFGASIMRFVLDCNIESVRRFAHYRYTSTGIVECVSTSSVSLPSTIAETPLRLCEAMASDRTPCCGRFQ